MKYKMVYLKFYTTENKLFEKELNTFLTQKQALLLTCAVIQHFKIPLKTLTFTNYEWGEATTDYEVRVPKNPRVLYLVHELAHLHNLHHYGSCYHNKKLLETIQSLIAYCNIKLKVCTPQAKTELLKIKPIYKKQKNIKSTRKNVNKKRKRGNVKNLVSTKIFNVYY